MWSNRPYTFDRVVRIAFTAILLGVLLYVVYVLRDVLLPFCVAGLVAYIIDPLVKWNQKLLHVKSHAWAVVITTFDAVVVFGLFCVIIVPIVSREFSQLSVLLDHYLKTGDPEITRFPLALHEFIHSHLDVDYIISQLDNVDVRSLWATVWTGLSHGLDKILGLLGWLIVIVYIIFILLDFDKFKAGIMNLIPNRYMPQALALTHDVSWTMKKYFRNQALISLITGTCYIIGFSIVGIPMAVVLGLMCMILFMVPYLVYLSVIPVLLMCLFKSMETGIDFWLIVAECAAVYVIVETFSDMVLTPHIMGKALGLNPALIILSLSIWGSLLGVLGMVIALPASTIIIKWSKMWIESWRNNLNSQDPMKPASDKNSDSVS